MRHKAFWLETTTASDLRFHRSEAVSRVGLTVCWFRTSATDVSRHRRHLQVFDARPCPPSKARLVITALFVDHQTPAEVAARYGVHRAWVYKLKARYEAEGESRARAPVTTTQDLTRPPWTRQGRRPASCESAKSSADGRTRRRPRDHRLAPRTPPRTTASPDPPSAAHLTAAGLVIPEPKKRPKSSYIRFEASMPNETWQSDFTHYRSPARRRPADVEIISWLDDCTRYALHVTAHPRITTPIVKATFRETAGQHGIPASTLTDNGMVYTVRLAGSAARRTQRLRDNNSAPGTWSRRTPAPTTPPPAARSNASSRP